MNITLEDFKVPNTCDECKFIGRYENSPIWHRNPHCCCELIWKLKKEDYKVDKDSIDENCPLKVIEQVRTEGEWRMVIDDFDDGVGERELPHCSNCGRGVYKHDASKYCPFCGVIMKNPMR